jgi:magnesium chelatase family protein
LEVYGIENIKQVINFFDKGEPLEQTIINTREEFEKNLDFPEHDFSDVRGQEGIKRCMEIAAAGGHNIMKIGMYYTVSILKINYMIFRYL